MTTIPKIGLYRTRDENHTVNITHVHEGYAIGFMVNLTKPEVWCAETGSWFTEHPSPYDITRPIDQP